MGKTELKILIGLHRNVNAIDKKTSKIAAEYNLTFSQFMVLEALYSKGDMSVGEVRERILSSVGTIPLIVNNLVKRNYVERLTDEKDRRVCILHLTKDGYDVISKVAHQNGSLGIVIEKQLFNRSLVWLILINQFCKSVKELFKPGRHIHRSVRRDRAVSHRRKLVPSYVDYAVTQYSIAGVHSQNPHFSTSYPFMY